MAMRRKASYAAPILLLTASGRRPDQGRPSTHRLKPRSGIWRRPKRLPSTPSARDPTCRRCLMWTAFHATPLQREPFDYLIVPGFLRPDALEALNRDYPEIQGPGNTSPDNLRAGPAFHQLLAELRSDGVRRPVRRQIRRRSPGLPDHDLGPAPLRGHGWQHPHRSPLQDPDDPALFQPGLAA